MSDFEDLFKIGLMIILLVGIPGLLYVGYRYAMMWLRRYEQEGDAIAAAAAGVDAETVARLEALEGHVAELQERLDFAERLLAQQGELRRLPEAGEVTPV